MRRKVTAKKGNNEKSFKIWDEKRKVKSSKTEDREEGTKESDKKLVTL